MATQLDSMVKEYEQQSLMMSEELKKAKEQDIVDMNNSMQSYQLSKVGPNGELTRKQAQLEFELVEKFKAAVNAPFSLAPAPSAAEAKELTAVIIC